MILGDTQRTAGALPHLVDDALPFRSIRKYPRALARLEDLWQILPAFLAVDAEALLPENGDLLSGVADGAFDGHGRIQGLMYLRDSLVPAPSVTRRIDTPVFKGTMIAPLVPEDAEQI